MKARLTLNERQLRLVMAAIEEYFRLRTGQKCCGLADDLAFQNVDLGENGTAERQALFDECISRRDKAEDILQSLFDVCSGRDWRHYSKTPQVEILIDVWSVIRHWFWEQREKNDKWEYWTVDSDVPRQWGEEPLPQIERVEDGD